MSRVLVVNDEPELLETCKLVLEISGQEVATCASLEELHEVMASFQPEVIVLDWVVDGHRSDQVLWSGVSHQTSSTRAAMENRRRLRRRRWPGRRLD